MWFPLIIALFLASLLAFSHGLLRWIAAQKADGYLQLLTQYWWIVGVAIGIYVFIFFFYAYILRSIAISVLYPTYTGLSIIFVFLMGAWFFNESMNLWQLIGCFLIVCGIFLVSGRLS